MPDLRTISVSLLGVQTDVDMQTAATNNIFTVPSGYKAYVTHVAVVNPSASLAGGTDYDFGWDASATNWKQTVDLSSMTTATTDYMIISGTGTKYTRGDAGDVFKMKVVTGSTAAATADIYVFGFLVAE
jgi:hypothetical protein